jgi:hypothetical protein
MRFQQGANNFEIAFHRGKVNWKPKLPEKKLEKGKEDSMKKEGTL